VVCSELADDPNSSATDMAEDLAAEVIREYKLPASLVWVEHYPEHEGEVGEYSLMRYSGWDTLEVCLGGVWRHRIGTPNGRH
jgi:hypothetical protein